MLKENNKIAIRQAEINRIIKSSGDELYIRYTFFKSALT